MKQITRVFIICSLALIATHCTQKTMDINTTAKPMKEDFRKSAPEAAPAPKIQFGDHQMYQMANGLKVIVVENHKLPRIAFRLVIDNDPIVEGPKSGLADMTGNMLSRGTMRRTKSKIDSEIDYLGATFNTGSNGFYAASLTKHKESLLDVISDVLLFPSFPQKEMDKIKHQMKSELQAAMNDPNQIASRASQAINFGADHPFGDVVTEQSIENITIDDCRSYYSEYWTPTKAYLAIVGDITFDEAREIVDEYFSLWDRVEAKSHQYELPKKSDTRVCFIDKPGAVQSVIRLTYPLGFAPDDPDRIPASVMNAILGGGVFSGYLMQNLREDKGYTYGARSVLSNNPVCGEFVAYASVRNEVTDSAVTEMIKEMNRIRNEDVDRDHLQLVKNAMSGSFARSLESSQTLANRIINQVRYNLPTDYYETYLEKLNAVSMEDVKRVAQRFIRPDNTNIIIVGNKEEVAAKLEPFGQMQKVFFYDRNGQPVRESSFEIPADIDARKVISRFLKSLGGTEKLKSIKNLVLESETEIQGQTMTNEKYFTSNGEFFSESKVQGMSVHKMIINREDVFMEQMGQQVEVTEDMATEMRSQVQLFREMSFLDEDYEVEILGTEVIDNMDAYVIQITTPDGKEQTDYYDVNTGLKVREKSIGMANQEEVVNIIDLGDYKMVDGLMFPHTITRQGVAPFSLVEKIVGIHLNAELDADLFKIRE